MAGNNPVGHTGPELEQANKPTGNEVTPRWREGIPKVIIEPLNPGVPEAR